MRFNLIVAALAAVYITTINGVPTTINNECMENLKLKANAGVCTNKITDNDFCVKTFGIPPAATGDKRERLPDELPDSACDDKTNIYLSSCAYTCGLCCTLPEHNCNDDPKAPSDLCTKKNCETSSIKEYTQHMCRGTCGYCKTPRRSFNNPNCADKNPNCEKYFKDQCKILPILKVECTYTCEFCNDTTNINSTNFTINQTDHGYNNNEQGLTPHRDNVNHAADLISNCSSNAHLCNTNLYSPLMYEICKKTCLLHGNKILGDEAQNCYDKNDNCVTWNENYQFCKSTFYTPEEKSNYCRRTCELC